MKKMKAPKKLALNKSTIRSLSAQETRRVNGGSIVGCGLSYPFCGGGEQGTLFGACTAGPRILSVQLPCKSNWIPDGCGDR